MNENEDTPDWLTEMDLEILRLLGSEFVLSPSIIAENIDRSREGVSNRLNSLQAGGLVEKVSRGKYKITPEGLEIVPGEWRYVVTAENDPDNTEMAIKIDDVEDIETMEDIEEALKGNEVYLRKKSEENP